MMEGKGVEQMYFIVEVYLNKGMREGLYENRKVSRRKKNLMKGVVLTEGLD